MAEELEPVQTVSYDAGADEDLLKDFLNDIPVPEMAPSLNRGKCKIKRDKKAEENKKVPGGSPLAKDIKEITQTILAESDCDALQQKVYTALNSLKDDIADKLGLTKEKLAEINPLLTIPLNPFKIPAWLKKFVIGQLLPDLEATIDMIVKTVEVINALTQLIQVIEQVLPNLKACALDLKRDIKQTIEDEIDGLVDDIKTQIAETIAEAICQGVNAAGIKAGDIETVLTGIDAVNDLVDGLKNLKSDTESALKANIDLIGGNQSTVQQITGIAPVLDTTSVESFLSSAQGAEYQQYKQDVASVLTLPTPVLSTAPVLTGNAVVGSAILCSNGEWQANGVVSNESFTYSHQWFRNGAEINGANTFTYIPTVDDVETKLYCMVTAQTNVTIEEAKSADTDFIAFGLTAENKPEVFGFTTVGSNLSCTTGTWPFTPTMTQYEWIRGTSTVVQSLSGNNVYKVASGDIGSTLKCKVVVQSFRYTLSDTTNPTVIVV